MFAALMVSVSSITLTTNANEEPLDFRHDAKYSPGYCGQSAKNFERYVLG